MQHLVTVEIAGSNPVGGVYNKIQQSAQWTSHLQKPMRKLQDIAQEFNEEYPAYEMILSMKLVGLTDKWCVSILTVQKSNDRTTGLISKIDHTLQAAMESAFREFEIDTGIDVGMGIGIDHE